MADLDIDLRQEFDRALNRGDARALKQVLKRALKGDADSYSIIQDFNEEATWDFTEEKEAKIIDALGKQGIPMAMSQQVLDVIAKTQRKVDAGDKGPTDLTEDGLMDGMRGNEELASQMNQAARTSNTTVTTTVSSFALAHFDPTVGASAFSGEDERAPDPDGVPDAPKKKSDLSFTPT